MASSAAQLLLLSGCHWFANHSERDCSRMWQSFAFAEQQRAPIAMLLPGGYTRASAGVIVDSLKALLRCCGAWPASWQHQFVADGQPAAAAASSGCFQIASGLTCATCCCLCDAELQHLCMAPPRHLTRHPGLGFFLIYQAGNVDLGLLKLLVSAPQCWVTRLAGEGLRALIRVFRGHLPLS